MRYLLLFLTIGICACTSQSSIVQSISVDQAKVLISDNIELIIVDARTPEEFAEGHLDKAINIDVKADHFKKEINKLSKDKSYLVYCRSGKRSTKASNIMAQEGFNVLYNMDGGYLAWMDQ